MKVYTYSQARQNLATLLEQAAAEGEVQIKRQDGQVFAVRPELRQTSPLDVPGVDLGLTANEIVQFVQEGRRALGWSSLVGQESAYAYAVNEAQGAAYGERAPDEGCKAGAPGSTETTSGEASRSQEDEPPRGDQRP